MLGVSDRPAPNIPCWKMPVVVATTASGSPQPSRVHVPWMSSVAQSTAGSTPFLASRRYWYETFSLTVVSLTLSVVPEPVAMVRHEPYSRWRWSVRAPLIGDVARTTVRSTIGLTSMVPSAHVPATACGAAWVDSKGGPPSTVADDRESEPSVLAAARPETAERGAVLRPWTESTAFRALGATRAGRCLGAAGDDETGASAQVETVRALRRPRTRRDGEGDGAEQGRCGPRVRARAPR